MSGFAARLAVPAALLLAGCVGYRAQPLAQAPAAPRVVARIAVDPERMPTLALASHRFDPADGLDMTEVAMLAVAGNPALRLARDDAGIAQAQAFAAGLLPDPQLALGGSRVNAVPATEPPTPVSSSFDLGLSMDTLSLLTHAANRRAARASAAGVDLGLLWQEWQTIAQAESLYLRICYQRASLPWLAAQRDLTEARYQALAHGLAARDASGDAATAALLAYRDARKQYDDAQRQAAQSRYDLNALLGLAADALLDLRAPTSDDPALQGPADRRSVADALAELPARRPDLLALAAGYQAQDARYRAAILGQFPGLSIGLNRARDNSKVYTTGLQLSLSLPLFNRNRGAIAVEQASRQRLHDEYQLRLDQAALDAQRLSTDVDLLAAQVADAQAALPALERVAAQASRAYASRDVSIVAYTDAQTAVLARRLEAAAGAEALAEQRLALRTLLGDTLPGGYAADLRWTVAHAD